MKKELTCITCPMGCQLTVVDQMTMVILKLPETPVNGGQNMPSMS